MSKEAPISETVDPKVLQAVYLGRIDKSLRTILTEIQAERDEGLYATFSLSATAGEKEQNFEANYPYTKVSSIEITNDTSADFIFRINDRSKEITVTAGRTKRVSFNRKVISSIQYRLSSGTGTVTADATW